MEASIHSPQLTSARRRCSLVLLLRLAKDLFLESFSLARSNCSWLTTAGTLCNEDPLLRWKRNSRVMGMTYGVGGRATDLRRAVTHAPGVDLARVEGVGQYPAQGGRAPRLPAPGRRDTHLPQVPREAKEAHPWFQISREDLRNHRGLRLVRLHPGGVARSVGIDPQTVGGVRPRQQEPALYLASLPRRILSASSVRSYSGE